jgi:hypothetical protein
VKQISEPLLTLAEKTRPADPRVASVLRYLENHLPDYPFSPDIDASFVKELIDDFPGIDILEEIKSFRWYYDNQPLAHAKKPRLALRRWVAKALKPRGEPW